MFRVQGLGGDVWGGIRMSWFWSMAAYAMSPLLGPVAMTGAEGI